MHERSGYRLHTATKKKKKDGGQGGCKKVPVQVDLQIQVFDDFTLLHVVSKACDVQNA